MLHAWARWEMHTEYQQQKIKRRDNLEDPVVILKWALQKCGCRMCNGFIWLMTGSSEREDVLSFFTKRGRGWDFLSFSRNVPTTRVCTFSLKPISTGIKKLVLRRSKVFSGGGWFPLVFSGRSLQSAFLIHDHFLPDIFQFIYQSF